jgi:hypothetical protein
MLLPNLLMRAILDHSSVDQQLKIDVNMEITAMHIPTIEKTIESLVA